MTTCSGDKLYKLYVKCVFGIEKYLHNELLSFGFPQNDMTISHSSVSISNVSLKHAYFLSYFSRFAKQIYLQLATFTSHNSIDLLNSCRNVEWSNYLNPYVSFMVKSDISRGLDSFKSNNYTSLVVKDAIMDYFAHKYKLNVDLKNPDLTFLLTINSAKESSLYVDLVGTKLNNRIYRHQSFIQDIDSTLANSLLDDSGYIDNSIISLEDYLNYFNHYPDINNTKQLYDRLSEKFITNYRKNSMIDTSCSIGTITIEYAMINSGISPGSFIRHFSSEIFNHNDLNALKTLICYSNMIRQIKKLKQQDFSVFGCEKSWEKINIAVHSANNAGVLRHIKFYQGSPLDTFQYIKDDITNPTFICTLPLTGELRKEIRNGKPTHLKKYHHNMLNKLLNYIKLTYKNPKLLLLIPNCFKKKVIEEVINQKLEGGRTMYFSGIQWACYNYNCNIK